jgi:cation:H+ antiporter
MLVLAVVAGAGLIVWGAERFATNLAAAAVGIGVSAFALAVLLAGAEPEELATTVTASLRDAPGIAFGDVIGANVAICLVAVGAGALVAPLPFNGTVRLYAWAGFPIALIAAAFVWDGRVDRPQGAVLVVLYVVYIGAIWIRERRPPALGETAEVEGASATAGGRRLNRELFEVLVGLAAMVIGAVLLVEAVRRTSGIEATQTNLGLTLVGFATAFELVVLAWAAARHGASEAAVAGVVGSTTYNLTMTLGAAALVRPLRLQDAAQLRPAIVAMLVAIVIMSALGSWRGSITRREGLFLIALYPAFVILTLVT